MVAKKSGVKRISAPGKSKGSSGGKKTGIAGKAGVTARPSQRPRPSGMSDFGVPRPATNAATGRRGPRVSYNSPEGLLHRQQLRNIRKRQGLPGPSKPIRGR